MKKERFECYCFVHGHVDHILVVRAGREDRMRCCQCQTDWDRKSRAYNKESFLTKWEERCNHCGYAGAALLPHIGGSPLRGWSWWNKRTTLLGDAKLLCLNCREEDRIEADVAAQHG